MVLDGVVNTTAYFRSDWAQELLSTDHEIERFFETCHSAGPDKCAFYSSTTDGISTRYNKLLDSVHTQPLSFASNGTYTVVDYATVKAALLQALYFPYPGWAQFAAALSALEKGDAGLVFNMTGGTTVLESQCS